MKMLRHIGSKKLHFCDENETKKCQKSGFFLNFEIQFFALVEIETNVMGFIKILCIHLNRLVVV